VDHAIEKLYGGPSFFGIKIQPSLSREDDLGLIRWGRKIQENILPAPLGGDILDKKHGVGNGIIKLSRFDIEMNPGQYRLGKGLDPFVIRPGGKIQGQDRRAKESQKRKEQNRPQKPFVADAQRFKSRYFRIGRHPAQSGKDTHQNRHGDGEGQHRRDEEHEQIQNSPERHSSCDEKFRQEEDLIHQKHKGVDNETNQKGRSDLFEDIAVK